MVVVLSPVMDYALDRVFVSKSVRGVVDSLLFSHYSLSYITDLFTQKHNACASV